MMARDQYDPLIKCQLVEEECIDIDLTSANLLCSYNASSSPNDQFEFQMISSGQLERQAMTSQADEFFYNGQLLPLPLLPLRRPQMVDENIIHKTAGNNSDHDQFEKSIIVTTPGRGCNAAAAPFESCINVSPATSCYVSGEYNPEDYFDECSSSDHHRHAVSSSHHHPKNKPSWSEKLKFIKQFTLACKLKASKAYIKSFFTTKSGSSSSTTTTSKVKQCSNAYLKTTTTKKTVPFGQIQMERFVIPHGEDKMMEQFSSTDQMNRNLSTKSLSSGEIYAIPVLQRSSSASSDMEGSIQGAIAYCKKSHQQLVASRRSASDVAGF